MVGAVMAWWWNGSPRVVVQRGGVRCGQPRMTRYVPRIHWIGWMKREDKVDLGETWGREPQSERERKREGVCA